MHKNTWKAFERRVAEFFGTIRTALSGSNSKVTRSDSHHDKLYIECKMRQSFSLLTLYKDSYEKAKIEDKIPVIAIKEYNKPHFYLLIREDHLADVTKYSIFNEEITSCN